jgi:hypothetical protein
MRVRLHRLRENEPDIELILGVLVLPFLMIAAFAVARNADRFPLFCLFHRWTGIPCPACGSFRCLQSLMAGHWRQAWLAQPLGTMVFFVASAFVIYAWGTVLLRLPRIRLTGVSRRQRALLVVFAFVAVAANWAYLCSRP